MPNQEPGSRTDRDPQFKPKKTTYHRSDLIRHALNLKLENINTSVLRYKAYQSMITDHVSIFEDVDGRRKIIKNRYGRSGIII